MNLHPSLASSFRPHLLALGAALALMGAAAQAQVAVSTANVNVGLPASTTVVDFTFTITGEVENVVGFALSIDFDSSLLALVGASGSFSGTPPSFPNAELVSTPTGVAVSWFDETVPAGAQTFGGTATLSLTFGNLGLVQGASTSVAFSGNYTTVVEDEIGNLDFPTVTLTPTSALVTAVPEPATWAMAFAGLGVLGAVTRRSRRRAGAEANA